MDKEDTMLDRTHAGFRCHTLQLLRTVQGNLPRGSQGTVAYEMDNLGRHLILVHWDQGFSVPVFPDEVEVYSAPHGSNRTPNTGNLSEFTSHIRVTVPERDSRNLSALTD
jgi:hypothetical protein